MPNYTEILDADGRAYPAPIVRGSRWPEGDGSKAVNVTFTDGWEGDEDDWTWTLRFSRIEAGGTPDLVLTADSVTIDGDVLTALFHATAAETGALPGSGKGMFQVDLASVDDAAEPSVWRAAHGTAEVRARVGQG